MQLDTIVSQDEWSFASLSLKLRGFPDFSQLFDRELGNSQLFDRELGNEDVVEQGDRDDTGTGALVRTTTAVPACAAAEAGARQVGSLGRVGGEAQGAAQFDSQANRLEPCGCQAFSAVAKRLSSPAKAPLLSISTTSHSNGQERLVISSLRLASARVAYLNGPPIDRQSCDDACSSQRTDSSSWDTPAPPPDWLSLHRCSSSEFSWVEWLGAIAPTVEVLIVRHGVPVEQVRAEWSCLRSLGIVVESEERFARDLDFERRRDDGEEEVTVGGVSGAQPEADAFAAGTDSFFLLGEAWKGLAETETPVVHVREGEERRVEQLLWGEAGEECEGEDARCE
ncbi:unnamed protein product [Closterium sp. NIES-64]|nr:unnamed protein product [Closterium sp. NIES-64]